MDESPLDELPKAYRIGLRLRALGADDALIADCLDIDRDGVSTLLDIGAHKLERAQDTALCRVHHVPAQRAGPSDTATDLAKEGDAEKSVVSTEAAVSDGAQNR